MSINGSAQNGAGNQEGKLFVIDPEDRARADLYGFIASMLTRPVDEQLLSQITAVEADETPLGQSIAKLAKIASVSSGAALEQEFNTLFIGIGRGELLPYASYYLTGFLNEKPLAKLRTDMAKYSIERTKDRHEPEDNIAMLFEMMAGLIVGHFGRVLTLEEQKQFFDSHIGSWAVHFFSDLTKSDTSVFYSVVGELGQTFMEIESEAFRMV